MSFGRDLQDSAATLAAAPPPPVWRTDVFVSHTDQVAQIEHNPDPARAARRCSGARASRASGGIVLGWEG